jgi:hypothetical protein
MADYQDVAIDTDGDEPEYQDVALGAAPPPAQDPVFAQDPVPVAPPPPIQTHTEGDLAFLKTPDNKIVSVPRDLASRYVAEQGLQPTSIIEVEKAKREAPGSFGSTVRRYYDNIASAAMMAARAPIAGYDALERVTPDALKPVLQGTTLPGQLEALGLVDQGDREDFLKATSPEGVRENFNAALAMVNPYLPAGADRGAFVASEADRATELRRRETALFPTLTAIADTMGQVVGSAPFGAVAPGGVTGLVAQGITESAIMGVLSEYDQAKIADSTINVEHLINSGLVSAAIGGVVSGAAGGISHVLQGGAKNFDKWAMGTTQKTIDDTLAAAKKGVRDAQTPENALLARAELEKAEFDEKIFAAMKAAGPNTTAQEKAAKEVFDKEVAFRRTAAGELDPQDWEKLASSETTGAQAALHRDNGLKGAAEYFTEKLNKFIDSSEELVEPLKNAVAKKEWVAQNFARSPDDMPDVFKTTGQLLNDANIDIGAIRKELGPLRSSRAAKATLAELDEAAIRAKNQLSKAASPEEAYVAIDELRDALRRHQGYLGRAVANSTREAGMAGASPKNIRALEILSERTREMYLKTANALADETLFGVQGATQKLVNGPGTGFVDVIKSDELALKHFVEVVDKAMDGTPIKRATYAKIHAYLSKLDDPKSRVEEFRQVLDTRRRLLQSVKQGYGSSFSGDAAKKVNETISLAEEVLSKSDTAEKVAIKLNNFARMAESEASRGAALPSRLLYSTLGMVLGGPAAAAVSWNLPQIFRAVSSGASKGLKAGAMELAGGEAQLVRWAHATRLKSDQGKHKLMTRLADVLDHVSGSSGIRVRGVSKKARALADATKGMAGGAEAVGKYSPPVWAQTQKDSKEQRKKHRERAALLSSIAADPTQLSDGPLGAVAYVNPSLYRSMLDETANRVAAIQQMFPAGERIGLLKRESTLSEQDVRNGEMLFRVLEDPMIVLEDFTHGFVNPDAVVAAQTIAPNTFQLLRAGFVDLMTNEDGLEISSNMLRQIDFLLGFDGELDGSLEDVKIAMMAAVAPEGEESQPSRGGPPRVAVGAEVASNAQTYSSKVASGAV